MPELPEVETIKRQLQKAILGKKISKVEVFLPKLVKVPVAKFKKTVEGTVIKNIWRRAKLLGFNLSNGYSLVIHLKLTGQLIFIKHVTCNTRQKHTHLIYQFTDGSGLLHNDLIRFGYVKLIETHRLSDFFKKENLGPEPLEDFYIDDLMTMLQKKPKAKIKPLLMDQTFIAGIGNLYADEILFFAGVHPERKVASLKPKEIKKIYQGIQKILSEAIKYQGSSVNTYLDIYGRQGNFVPRLKVYRRDGERCLKCEETIKRIKLGSRSAHFCPNCQK